MPLDFYSKSPGGKSSRYRTAGSPPVYHWIFCHKGRLCFQRPIAARAVAPRDVRYPYLCQYAQAALNSELRTLRPSVSGTPCSHRPAQEIYARIGLADVSTRPSRTCRVARASPVATKLDADAYATDALCYRYLSGDGGRTAK